jgi:predicted RNA binding protein YcfA (HicA-like mRNA interferase family)
VCSHHDLGILWNVGIFYLVMAIVGIPSLVLGIWQFAVLARRGVQSIRRVLQQRAEARALDRTPAPPSRGPAIMTLSYRQLARTAREAGWRIERAAGHHNTWVSPDGARVIVPSTPHDLPSFLLKRLHQAGLEQAAA